MEHSLPSSGSPVAGVDRMKRSQDSNIAGELRHSHAKIWQTVARIPRGTVASYGQVAQLAGLPRRARLVGQALRRAPPGFDLPWHRVVSASGTISLSGQAGQTQARLLAGEGILLVRGRIDMKRYRWAPRSGSAHRAGWSAHRSSGSASSLRHPYSKRRICGGSGPT